MTDRPPPVSPEDRLYRIVEDGMCIGCGLCQSVAGAESVRMEVVDSGELHPLVVGPLAHETVDRIYDVCPGTRVDGLPTGEIDETTREDLVWGPYQRMVTAWASDPEVRWRCSTGGVLTALGQFLLNSGRVDFVLHVRAGQAEPSFGERWLSFTEADVLAGAGSRYGPTAPLVDLEDALARGRRFAFIGKPCDAAALRNYARHDERVDALVQYWLAPVCGGFMPPAGMSDFLARVRIEPERIAKLSYRGGGCPGPTRIEMDDGAAREFDYLDVWGEDESSWSLPFRCKVCPDGIGEAVDIAAADNWPGGAPERGASEHDPGDNAVIIRTTAGMALIKAAAADGYLTLGAELNPRHMDSVQPHQARKKHVVRARWDGLAAEGRITPRSARLRLDALAEANGAEDNAREFEGTRRRVREGRTTLPRPMRRGS